MSHKAFTALTGVGFSEEQAEALVEAASESRDDLATKADIAELRSKMQATIQALELRLTLRLGGMVVAGVAIIAVLTRL